MPTNSTLTFGSYDWICTEAPLIVCPLLRENGIGYEPACYSRNLEVNSTLIFQPASCFIHIVAMIMTVIMIAHVSTKYTAIGRREIVLFFSLFLVEELLAFFLDSAIAPISSDAYAWLAAIHTGLTVSLCWTLMYCGFVNFQFIEDGSALSVWLLRSSALAWLIIVTLVSIGTFKGAAGLKPDSPVALWVFEFLFNGICMVVFFISQVVLVFKSLDDLWPLGDLLLGLLFYAAGQVIQYAFSTQICEGCDHYVDGQFFASLMALLAVMMVYKYWDSITKEDLEFSVGSKQAAWEVKENFMDDMASANSSFSDVDPIKGPRPPQPQPQRQPSHGPRVQSLRSYSRS